VPVVAQVWKREAIFAGPCLELAPDLTLVLEDGGLVSILASASAIRPRPQPTGTHRPQGIFAARGPGLRRGVRLAPLSLLDVAPLILYTLGLPIPAEWEGCAPLDAYEPATVQARPVQTAVAVGRPATQRAPAEAEAGLDDDGEREIMGRLRALGYLE
jgi:hypothetical protein